VLLDVMANQRRCSEHDSVRTTYSNFTIAKREGLTIHGHDGGISLTVGASVPAASSVHGFTAKSQ